MNDRDYMQFAQFSQDELIQLDDEYFDLLAHEFGLPFDEAEQHSGKLSNLE